MLFLQLAGNIVMENSLGSIFEMINNLQLTFHIPAINIYKTMPPNALAFNSVMIDVVQFEVIPEALQQYLYIWKLSDGTYLQEEDEEQANADSSGRLLQEVDNT